MTIIVGPTTKETTAAERWVVKTWAPPDPALVERFRAGAVAHRHQEWFWAGDWLAGEAEAQAQIDAGDLEVFADGESFLRSLD